jgi:hypothetical protein
MPEVRNWKWDPHERDAGKADGNDQSGLEANKSAEPKTMRKAS